MMDDSSTSVVSIGQITPRKSLPADIRGCLEIINGPEKGRLIFLEEAYSTIGRKEDNHAVLTGSEVSSRHAAIFFSEGLEWRISDLGSTNGTLLNGSKVAEYALRSGDKILIGPHMMVFTVEHV